MGAYKNAELTKLLERLVDNEQTEIDRSNQNVESIYVARLIGTLWK